MNRWRAPWVAVLLLVALPCGCGLPGSGAPYTPSWGTETLRSDHADFVAAFDLEAMRADPLFGPVLAQLARESNLQALLRASQIDVVGMYDESDIETWVAVIHDVRGAPGPTDVGAGLAAHAVTVPGAWLIGEGPAFERVRAQVPLPHSLDRMAMPRRAYAAMAMQGAALKSKPGPLDAFSRDVTRVTGALIGGSHLDVVLQAEYTDSAAAHRGAALTRVLCDGVTGRGEEWERVTRTLTGIDVQERGNVLSVRAAVSDSVRDLLRSYVEGVRL
jgi:hypothetical protein